MSVCGEKCLYECILKAVSLWYSIIINQLMIWSLYSNISVSNETYRCSLIW